MDLNDTEVTILLEALHALPFGIDCVGENGDEQFVERGNAFLRLIGAGALIGPNIPEPLGDAIPMLRDYKLDERGRELLFRAQPLSPLANAHFAARDRGERNAYMYVMVALAGNPQLRLGQEDIGRITMAAKESSRQQLAELLSVFGTTTGLKELGEALLSFADATTGSPDT